MENYYTYYQIAEKLDVGVDTVRRHISKMKKKLDIEPIKKVTKSSKGSQVNCLRINDSHKFISYIKNRDNFDNSPNAHNGNFGFFYLIQLIPEHDPNRIEIGFADNLEKRLKEHQTSSPTAKLIKTWPCKRAWDQAVMDSITRENCVLVLNEVYEGDLELFIQRTESFFKNMPNRITNIELSNHSPLNNE
jgi:hypothetical protein